MGILFLIQIFSISIFGSKIEEKEYFFELEFIKNRHLSCLNFVIKEDKLYFSRGLFASYIENIFLMS